MTIVLPIDHAAVEAVELACLALTGGELSEAATDLDRFLDRLTADPAGAERFPVGPQRRPSGGVVRARPLTSGRQPTRAGGPSC